MDLNDKIFELHDKGKSATSIARSLKIKKAEVLDVLGNAANKGLGDVVEAITEATGIKKVVEAITEDCGCAARKEKLNEWYPNRKLNDLSLDDYAYLKTFFAKTHHTVDSKEQKALVDIYNNVFNAKRTVSNCSPCVKSLVSELKNLYERAQN